jgi:beta-lactamase class A
MRPSTLTLLVFLFAGCAHLTPKMPLKTSLNAIDLELRRKYGMETNQWPMGVLDLKTGEAAMIEPDRVEYAASVAKIGILIAWFHLHPDGIVEAQTRHELGLMVKASSNEMATKFSEQIGLRKINEILATEGFYDAQHGGIWVGKHYGKSGERIPDPVGGHSHAVTVRQLLRFYQLLNEGKLISPAASKTMREIFASPEIPHDQIKFVKGLAGRGVTILRKWGSWENYLHDSALIEGQGRRYVLVALVNHPRGDEFLEDLARAIDDEMIRRATSK